MGGVSATLSLAAPRRWQSATLAPGGCSRVATSSQEDRCPTRAQKVRVRSSLESCTMTRHR